MKKVSVIITTYNDEWEWLSKSIESILAQQGVVVQLIVSIPSGDINQSMLIDDHRLNIVSTGYHTGRSPEGSFFQLNAALPLITGDYFCYFSGNDIMMEDKLITDIQAMGHGKVGYTGYINTDESLNHTGQFHPPHYNYKDHLKGNFIPDCTVMKKELIDKYGPFRSETYGNYAFWDFWLRVYEGEGNVFGCMDEPTWYYIQHERSMHIQRQKSPQEINRCNALRRKMLASHGA